MTARHCTAAAHCSHQACSTCSLNIYLQIIIHPTLYNVDCCIWIGCPPWSDDRKFNSIQHDQWECQYFSAWFRSIKRQESQACTCYLFLLGSLLRILGNLVEVVSGPDHEVMLAYRSFWELMQQLCIDLNRKIDPRLDLQPTYCIKFSCCYTITSTPSNIFRHPQHWTLWTSFITSCKMNS